MRLIDTETLTLEDYPMARPPTYAILSHTWEDEEVSYQEMTSPTAATIAKKGYAKIAQTCRQAQEDMIGWVWIDTCCIDKRSSAELTEAINSMYEWYHEAVKCYVYLSDLRSNQSVPGHIGGCRWFTRGWTLQELLAPAVVEFFDQDWKLRGSKMDFVVELSERTNISRYVLRGQKSVQNCSVATRMSWAAKRETTRQEDMAYCLLGIFGVNMPLIYGERARAFRRLQEVIIQNSNDLTILAWEQVTATQDGSASHAIGVLAPSPANFVGMTHVTPFTDDFLGFQVTNKGLFISGDFSLRIIQALQPSEQALKPTYALFLGSGDNRAQDACGICLRKVGPELFYRDNTFPIAGFGRNQTRPYRSLQARDCYVMTEPLSSVETLLGNFRKRALYVPDGAAWTIGQVVPESLWDATDRIFLRPKPYTWIQYEVVTAVEVEYKLLHRSLRLVVLCDMRQSPPCAKVLDISLHKQTAALVFTTNKWDRGITWYDLESRVPATLSLPNYQCFQVNRQQFKISAIIEDPDVSSARGSHELYFLQLVSAIMPTKGPYLEPTNMRGSLVVQINQ